MGQFALNPIPPRGLYIRPSAATIPEASNAGLPGYVTSAVRAFFERLFDIRGGRPKCGYCLACLSILQRSFWRNCFSVTVPIVH